MYVGDDKQGPHRFVEIWRASETAAAAEGSAVRILESVGLIERTEDDRVVVPWDVITAELKLVA